jgi:5'-3' exonuclease
MGVRKLNKFLTNRNIIQTYHNLDEFIININSESRNNSNSGKIVIAIDFWLYAHKFLHSNRSENILFGFWKQIMKFLSCGAIPLYVMDGSVPIEKLEKVIERNNKINKHKKRLACIDEEIQRYININDLDMAPYDSNKNLGILYETREKIHKHVKRIKLCDLYDIHRLFDVLEIPYIKAEFEADALCAKLYKDNIITCCLSDDTDMLVLGCGSTIKFHEGCLVEFNLDKIMVTLGITQEQFIDMCILFGCDYLHHPLKIDGDDIYSLIKIHGSLLDALCSNDHTSFNMENRNVQVIGDNYYYVKDIYLNSCNREYVPDDLINFKMNKINLNNLTIFLKHLKWFDTSDQNLKIIEKHIHFINNKIDDNEI